MGDPNPTLRPNMQQHAIPIVPQKGKVMVKWLIFYISKNPCHTLIKIHVVIIIIKL
jgi:hypothetical protein